MAGQQTGSYNWSPGSATVQTQTPINPYGQVQYPTQIQQAPVFQQARQQNLQYLPGRVLMNPNDTIKPNEVPMDGTVAVFPAHDFSTIYIKGWNNDGTIGTIEYVRKNPSDAPPDSGNSFEATISARLDKIESMLKSLAKQKTYRPRNFNKTMNGGSDNGKSTD